MADTIGPIEVPFVVEIQGTAEDLRKVFAAAKKDLKAFGSGLQAIGSQVGSMGRSLTAGLTLPIVGAGAAALKASIDWEQAMTGVAKTLDTTGLSAEETAAFLAGLGDEFQRMSEQIPVSANELAGIAEVASQLGVSREDLAAFTRVMADLGVTTDMSAEQAATALAQFANITNTSLAEVDRMGSTIVELGNRLATTESQVTEFGLRIAGAGEIAGLAEAEILAIGAAVASVGVGAEAGGTAVQKVLLAMTEAVATGGDELRVFAKTAGMEMGEFARVFREDAGGAFTAFVEGLGRAGDDAFQILEALSLQDQRLIRAFLSLANAGDLLRTSIDLGNSAWAENEALTAEAERFYATLGNRLKVLRNQIVNTAAELGEHLRPAFELLIEEAIKPLLGFIRSAVEAFGQLDPRLQAVIIVFAGLLAALGPVLIALGSLIGLVGGAIAGWGAITAAAAGAGVSIAAIASTIGIAVAALVALVAALVLAWRESETFREVVTEVWDAVKLTFDQVVENFEHGILALRHLWAEWGDEITAVWNVTLRPVLEWLATLFETAFRAAGDAIEFFLAVVRGDWKEAGRELLEIAQEIVSGLIEAFGESHLGQLVHKVREIAGEVVAAWEDLKDRLVGNSIVPDMVDEVIRNFDRMHEQVLKQTDQTVDEVVTRWGSIDRVVEINRRAADALVAAWEDPLGTVKTGFEAVIRQFAMGDGVILKTRQSTAELGLELGNLGSTASGTASELQNLIDGLRQQAETAGMTAEELLRHRLETLNADEATTALALSLHEAAGFSEELREELRRQGDRFGANRKKVDDYIKSIEELHTWQEDLNEATQEWVDVLNVAEREERDQITLQSAVADAVEFSNREFEGLADRIGEVGERFDEAGRPIGRFRNELLRSAAAITGGFSDSIRDVFHGLQTVSEEVFGGAGGGLLKKLGGFGEGLLAMAGPGGAIFGAVDAIGKLFGVNLVNAVNEGLKAVGFSISNALADLFGIGGDGGVDVTVGLTFDQVLLREELFRDSPVAQELITRLMEELNLTATEAFIALGQLIKQANQRGMFGFEAVEDFLQVQLDQLDQIPAVLAQFGFGMSESAHEFVAALVAAGKTPAEIVQALTTLSAELAESGLGVEEFFARELKRREAEAKAAKLARQFGIGQIESARAFIAGLVLQGKSQAQIFAILTDLIRQATEQGADTAAELEEFFHNLVDPETFPGFPSPVPPPEELPFDPEDLFRPDAVAAGAGEVVVAMDQMKGEAAATVESMFSAMHRMFEEAGPRLGEQAHQIAQAVTRPLRDALTDIGVLGGSTMAAIAGQMPALPFVGGQGSGVGGVFPGEIRVALDARFDVDGETIARKVAEYLIPMVYTELGLMTQNK